MDPALEDGVSVLVDHSRIDPADGQIFALGTGDGPLVKRLRPDGDLSRACSDNKRYEPQLIDGEAEVIGRVAWWGHTVGFNRPGGC